MAFQEQDPDVQMGIVMDTLRFNQHFGPFAELYGRYLEQGVMTVEYGEMGSNPLGLFSRVLVSEEVGQPMTMLVDYGQLLQQPEHMVAGDVIRSLTVAWKIQEGKAKVDGFIAGVANQHAWARGTMGRVNQFPTYQQSAIEAITPQIIHVQKELVKLGVGNPELLLFLESKPMLYAMQTSPAALASFNIRHELGVADFMVDCSHGDVKAIIDEGVWQVLGNVDALQDRAYFIAAREQAATVSAFTHMDDLAGVEDEEARRRIAAEGILAHHIVENK